MQRTRLETLRQSRVVVVVDVVVVQRVRVGVVVVVFFTLTDWASAVPSNIRGCQSDTWSAEQKKIRGTSTKLQ